MLSYLVVDNLLTSIYSVLGLCKIYMQYKQKGQSRAILKWAGPDMGFVPMGWAVHRLDVQFENGLGPGLGWASAVTS